MPHFQDEFTVTGEASGNDFSVEFSNAEWNDYDEKVNILYGYITVTNSRTC